MPEELEQDWMEELNRALEHSDASALLAAAENVHYADLADLIATLKRFGEGCTRLLAWPS